MRDAGLKGLKPTPETTTKININKKNHKSKKSTKQINKQTKQKQQKIGRRTRVYHVGNIGEHGLERVPDRRVWSKTPTFYAPATLIATTPTPLSYPPPPPPQKKESPDLFQKL